MSKTLYLMRHGQTLFNVRRRIQGACDSPLTELGVRQAKGAAEYFKNIPLDHLYSSTSERASHTLEIVTDYRMPYRRLQGLKEINFGIYEGESEDLIPDSETMSTFFVKHGGESTNEVLERMVQSCTNIMEQKSHQIVLAVSHAFSCIQFMSAWTDPTEHLKKGITNCCIFKYEYEDGEFTLTNVIRPEPINH